MTTICIDNPVAPTVAPEMPMKYGDCWRVITWASGRTALTIRSYMSVGAHGSGSRELLTFDEVIEHHRAPWRFAQLRRSRGSGNPASFARTRHWVPAFAGTTKLRVPGVRQ